MPERPHPPSIPLHFSDFDFNAATLETNWDGDDDFSLVQEHGDFFGGDSYLQQCIQEDDALGGSLDRSSASPSFSDFDFGATITRSDDDFNNGRYAFPYDHGDNGLEEHGLADGPDAGTRCFDPDDRLTMDTDCRLQRDSTGFEGGVYQDNDYFDDSSQEGQVVPDQERAYSMLEEIVFNDDGVTFERGDGVGLEFWVGDERSESFDWLAFEKVFEPAGLQNCDQNQDDFLHSSDWAMLEDKFEDTDREAGSTVPSDEYLHSSDWAILADIPPQHDHLERSRDLQSGDIQELGATQPESLIGQDQGFTGGQTDGTALNEPETASTSRLGHLFMTTSPRPREWVLEKLELMACQVLKELAWGRTPEIELSSRTRAEAIVYDDENGVVRRLQDRSPLDAIERPLSSPLQEADESMEQPLRHTRDSQSVKCAPCVETNEAEDGVGHGDRKGTRSAYSKVTRYNDRQVRTFSRILRLSSIIHEGMDKQTVASKRDLFYRDVSLFRSQPVVDKMVEDMACTLRVPRSSLNVMAGGRSILFGSMRLTIKVRHQSADDCDQSSAEQQKLPGWLHSDISQAAANADDPCMVSPESIQPTEEDSLHNDYMRTDYNTPVTLPGFMDDIVHIEIHPKTLFVLVIEKESTFLHLARSGFCNTHGPCILLTSKGYPDFVARQLLKHLECMVQDGVYTMFLPCTVTTSRIPALRSYSTDCSLLDQQPSLQIPLLALVDCDPHGFKIFLTYRCGSVECAYDNANLAVPSLECLGQFPIDWDPLLKGEKTLLQERLERQLIPLLPRDRSALVKLLTRHPFIKQSREWQVRISRMLMANRKSEIQSLDLGEVEREAVVPGEGHVGGLGHYLKNKLQSYGVYSEKEMCTEK
ncbi:endodeoxyribonuclease [Mortierella alpina]|nr:endodeoxyribonuclease [Mortierella alpina]